MTRRLTQRGKERRRQLMDFAAARFAENGYHPTSVQEIVTGLGVGKGVFYWYFSSKEELFLEILRDAQQDLRRAQRHAIADEPDPIERIEKGIRTTLDWSSANRDLLSLVQFAATEERFAPALRRGQDIAIDDLVRHVKEGIVAGRIRDGDPTLIAHGILGVTGHLSRVFILERREPTGEVADAAVWFCLEGILARDERR